MKHRSYASALVLPALFVGLAAGPASAAVARPATGTAPCGSNNFAVVDSNEGANFTCFAKDGSTSIFHITIGNVYSVCSGNNDVTFSFSNHPSITLGEGYGWYVLGNGNYTLTSVQIHGWSGSYDCGI